MLIQEFDTWRQGYQNATVRVYKAGTTQLAQIYEDEELTVELSNPQTLSSELDASGNSYGKFQTSVYVGVAYYLDINRDEEGGVHRPMISSLNGEDASASTVTVSGSSQTNTLAEIVARTVFAENYGEITIGSESGSAATNTATIEAAIGALTNGGVVILPSGVISINQLTLSSDIILRGQGINSTVLESIVADTSITLGGDNAGLEEMTLNGNNLTSGSIGFYGVNKITPIFNNFKIKNFQTGIYLKGSDGYDWRNFHIENCEINAKVHGDSDEGDTGNGGVITGGRWIGGACIQATTYGLDIEYVDEVVSDISFSDVTFSDNTGTAVYIRGARNIPFDNCSFIENTKDFDIDDDDTVLTPDTQYQNTVYNISMNGGSISGTSDVPSSSTFSGTLRHVAFNGVGLYYTDLNMVAPVENNVYLRSCYEKEVTLSGDTTMLVRQSNDNTYEVSGITTGDEETRACGIELAAGEIVYLEAKVIGRQRNSTGRAIYHVACGAYREGSALLYINQTDDFTVGDIITGGTSGATARLQVDTDSGTSGTLTLIDITGEFVDGEEITGSSSGTAEVSGTLISGSYSLDTIGLTNIRTAYETDTSWDVSFSASAAEIAINVTGYSSETIDWLVHVEKVALS